MEIINATSTDWLDYEHDIACRNIVLETYINDISERSYELRSETSIHNDVMSTMLMTRDVETKTVFAVRVTSDDRDIDAIAKLDSMHCTAAALLSDAVDQTERFVRQHFANK